MTTLTTPANSAPAPSLNGTIAFLGRLIHERFFWFLLAACAAASCCPGPGLWLRGVSFGAVSLCGEKASLSLPTLMLAVLLFGAGLGVQTAQLRRLLRDPKPLVAGLVANLAIPVAFLVGISLLMGGWLNADHLGSMLVGLALIASMPVAATSTLWSQHAHGNLALSLGLVLLSTLLSPLTTPVVFQAVSLLAHGDYAALLYELGAQGAGAFLTVAVLLPSALGLGGKVALGEARVAPARPLLKLVSSVNFLVLTYANASAALPQVLANPDLRFLAVTLAVVAGLCVTAFTAGWAIARLLRADPGQQTALVFGLGMNSNAVGLVLASATLVSHPLVIVPILTHTLVQQLVAGVADLVLGRTARGDVREPAPALPERAVRAVEAGTTLVQRFTSPSVMRPTAYQCRSRCMVWRNVGYGTPGTPAIAPSGPSGT
jgi:bile acid:Na+ symporter, BASS family